MLTLGRYTLQDLIHDRGRSLLTILSLAVVVLSYLLLSALSQAYLAFGRQNVTSRNLLVINSDVIDPMESSLSMDVLQNAQQIAPDQIQQVFPSIFRHMRIAGQTMQVHAVPYDALITALNLTLLQGHWPSGLNEVAMSEGAALITPWKIGSIVNIYGTDFHISGLVRASGNKFASLWITYPAGQALFGDRHGFQIGYLRLVPTADPEAVRSQLQADPRLGTNLSVYLENTLSNRYNDVNQNLLVLSGIQAFISLLAITFGTYNAASLTLTERSTEIDLLRLIGFTQSKVRIFLFSRILVQTLAAFFTGWLVAFLVVAFRQAHSPIDIQAAPLTLHLDLASSLLGLGLSILFAFLGVWLTTARPRGEIKLSFN